MYLKVAFRIYNKKVNYTVYCTIPKYIWTRAPLSLSALVQYGSHRGTCPNIFRYCTVNCIITYTYCISVAKRFGREPPITTGDCEGEWPWALMECKFYF